MPRKRPPRPSFILELAMTNAFVSQVFDQELLRDGIRPVQAGVLTMIAIHGPVTPSQLERESGLPGGTLRDRVRGLVREGLVRTVPNPEDQRSHFLEVTGDGARLVEAAAPIVRRVEKMLAEQLGHDLDDLRGPLAELRAAARASLDTGAPASRGTRTTGPW